MKWIARIAHAAVALSATVNALGCRSRPLVELTRFDATQVTELAMQQLDTNNDQCIDRNELQHCPGLLTALPQIDLDQNRELSFDELNVRLQTYVDQQIAILPVPIYVTYRRRPLIGATVRLVPEAFLAEHIELAEGVTDPSGVVRPSIPLDSAVAETGNHGFRSGVYRVHISLKGPDGSEMLPAEFNTESKVGLEVKMEEHTSSLRLDL